MKGRDDKTMAVPDRVDDIQRVKPDRCPRCGKEIVIVEDDKIKCPDCGELYYDEWLGIYRIKC